MSILFSAGCTLKSKRIPYVLLLVGLILISVSLGLNFLFLYRINSEYSINSEFKITEGSERTFKIEISKEVASLSYELLVNATTKVNITVRILGTNGLILDSERRTIINTGKLSKNVILLIIMLDLRAADLKD